MIGKVYQSDIETFLGYSLFTFWNTDEDEWYEFSINQYENDLLELVSFLRNNRDVYFSFYNGLKFDLQVIQFVLDHYKNWLDLPNLDVCQRIWQRAQDEINNSNYEVRNTYYPSQFDIKGLDLMEIPHFTNANKRTSLKWLAFMLDMESIEDLPYKHDKKDFTKEECLKVRLYCRKDVKDTYAWWKYLRGQTDHPEYKGKDKIQERVDLIEELKFPADCLNWNDVKIGDEMNKVGYCELTKKSDRDLYNLKKNRGGTKKFTFGDAIPEYVKFTTPEFQKFHSLVKKERVSLMSGDKQQFMFTYNGTTYSIMRGGIHSTEGARVIIPADDEILRDADVGSQYPNAIVKRGLYPSHLGPEWLVNYKNTISKRLVYKEKGKTDVKFKSLSDMFKLALNGGGFGKTNENTSWQYDPRVTYFCTIGNQFEILMLIEMLETNGIHCISANTDGILCLFKKDLEATYNRICGEWEVIVGNTEQGKLEFVDFKKLWQESVNHYIAIKKDGKSKIKGRFAYEVELSKNNTDKIGRIERKAIVEYVTKGTPVETTVKGSKNIFDYCIGLKSSKLYFFRASEENKKDEEYTRVIRFYVSNKGKKLFKIKREGAETNGAKITKVVDPFKVTMFLDYEKKKNYDINYDYYTNKANEIIFSVENNGHKRRPPSEGQMTLF